MKKAAMIICVLIVLISFVGCVFSADFYSGKRPYDYGKAMWICESPNAWFIVNASEDDENFIYPKGEIAIGDQIIRFTISFGYGKETSFVDENDNLILIGTCKFSSENLVIYIDKDKDTLFNGQYDTITFVRNTSAETTNISVWEKMIMRFVVI